MLLGHFLTDYREKDSGLIYKEKHLRISEDRMTIVVRWLAGRGQPTSGEQKALCRDTHWLKQDFQQHSSALAGWKAWRRSINPSEVITNDPDSGERRIKDHGPSSNAYRDQASNKNEDG